MPPEEQEEENSTVAGNTLDSSAAYTLEEDDGEVTPRQQDVSRWKGKAPMRRIPDQQQQQQQQHREVEELDKDMVYIQPSPSKPFWQTEPVQRDEMGREVMYITPSPPLRSARHIEEEMDKDLVYIPTPPPREPARRSERTAVPMPSTTSPGGFVSSAHGQEMSQSSVFRRAGEVAEEEKGQEGRKDERDVEASLIPSPSSLPSSSSSSSSPPHATPFRSQRSRYAEPADWSQPSRNLAIDPGFSPSAFAPPAAAPEVSKQESSKKTATPTSITSTVKATPRRRAPPANAAHLPKQVSSDKGPYYIPQSAPEAPTAKANPATGSSSTEMAAAHQDPAAMNRVAPGMFSGNRPAAGSGSSRSSSDSSKYVHIPNPTSGVPVPSAAMGVGISMPSMGPWNEGVGGANRNVYAGNKPWYNQIWDGAKSIGRSVGNGLAKLDEDFWRWQNSRS